MHRLQETAQLPHPPEAVWSLIEPAEHATLVSPRLRRAFHVPGTPHGVGEQQAFTDDDGVTTVVEVVELVPDRRAVTVLVSPAPAVPTRTVHEVLPVVGGCLYTLRLEYDAPAHAQPTEQQEQAWREGAVAHLDAVRRVMQTWSA